MNSNPRDALDEARDAFREKRYLEALEKYSYFFDHALDDDPAALYGVRLSYCLIEWAKLGEKYPEALVQLKGKRDAALEELKKTREPEKFHDYIEICRYLKCQEMPVDTFICIHEKDRTLAESIVWFIWDVLIENNQWNICGEYIDDAIKEYEKFVLKYDQAISVCKSDPSLGGDEFEDQIKGWYVRDVSNLILVLKNNEKTSEAKVILSKSSEDLKARKYSELIERINNRVAL